MEQEILQSEATEPSESPVVEKKKRTFNMKVFRIVYYIVIGLLLVAMFALSVVDLSGTTVSTPFDTQKAVVYNNEMTKKNSYSIYDSSAHDERVKYLTDKLDTFGLNEVLIQSSSNGNYTTAESNVTVPSYTSAKMTMRAADRIAWEKAYTGKDYANTGLTNVTLTDIVSYFPANGDEPTKDVILFMAHYDSVMMGPGANDDLTSVSAMLEVIRMLTENEAKHNNDYLFVFTDGEEEGMYGAKMMEKFIGYDQAFSRVAFASNFESRGTGGSVIMFQSSANNYNLIKNWSKIRTTEFASGVSDLAYSMMPNYTDFAVVPNGVPALNFANIGNGEDYHTQNDSTPNATVINNHGAMMLSLLDAFGNTDLSQLVSNSSAVYFSYLDGGTVVFSTTFAYILGVFIVLIALGALLLGAKKKTLNLKEIGKGLGFQVLVLLGSVLFALAAYYLVGLIIAACGVVSVHALPTLMFSSIPMVFFAGLVVVAFSMVLYHIIRVRFKINAGDMVRGQILLWVILGALISFIFPTASSLFAWLGFAEAMVLLTTAIFKDMYKRGTSESIDKLLLSVIPMIFLAPLFFGIYFLLGDALGASVYYVTTAFAVLFAGLITPYFSVLTPKLSAWIAKLPGASVRVSRTVTEPVEDDIKKGKYVMKTHRKVTRERVALTYRTWHGAVGLLCIGLIVVFSLCSGGNFSDNISGSANGDRRYTDDAVVYVIDKTSTAPYDHYWMVNDLDAYYDIAAATTRFSWSGKVKAYVQKDTLNTTRGDAYLPTVSNVNYSEKNMTKSFNVSTKLNMKYSLTFTNTARIKSISVYSYLNNGSYSSQMEFTPNVNSDYTIDGLFGQSSITINLRTSADYSSPVTFNGKYVDFAYTEEAGDQSRLLDFEGVWEDVKTYYTHKEDVLTRLRAGVQILGYSLSTTTST